MGLAASQARLLTITARKSDCEFQSMRYSHQKIALSRNMTDISNEYQNALNQTKLVYDYYGTGDASTPLTYGLMMTPSELNGHMPILTTDASGKIVLNTQFAAAARAAGIPQEGLGCLPSTTVRNKYLKALADYGLISQEAAATYQGIFYAQEIGVGTTDLVTSTVQKMNLEEMLDYYASYGDYSVYADLLTELKSGQVGSAGANGGLKDVAIYNGYNNTDAIDPATLSIIDILEGNYKIICKTSNNGYDDVGKALGSLNVWEWMFEEMAGMLNISGDANISGAIAYAESMTRGLLDYDDGHAHYYGRADKGFGVMNYDYNDKGAHTVVGALFGDKTQVNTSSYIGIVDLERSNWFSKQDFASIDMTNIAKAYLTYFAQYMEGITTSEYMISSDSSNRKVSDSHLIDDKFMFDVLVNQGVNTDQALNSGFYDAMFNQICLKIQMSMIKIIYKKCSKMACILFQLVLMMGTIIRVIIQPIRL